VAFHGESEEPTGTRATAAERSDTIDDHARAPRLVA